MLTKSDLSAIDEIVTKRVKPLEKGQKQLKKRFDELFKFLDKKYVQTKTDIRKIQAHLDLPVSEY